MEDDLTRDPPQASPVDDLFGGDALDLGEAEAPSKPSRRFGGGGRRPQMSWVIMGVGGLLFLIIFWYLSSAQRDRYYIEVDDGQVSVERGLFFPFGSGEWQPNRAYKPFTLPPGVTPEKTGAMTAEEADQVLFSLYMTIADRQVKDLDGGDPELAEEMLLRANKLNHTTTKDDRKLLSMMGDVHFTRGISQIRGIQAQFDEALAQFRMAAQRGGVTYKGAHQWVEAIERLRSEFRILSERSGINPDEILARPPRPLDLKARSEGAEGEEETKGDAADAGPPEED
ncbi:MAG: hypothetical protein ACE366_27725 [Bradymonadia bacterium]